MNDRPSLPPPDSVWVRRSLAMADRALLTALGAVAALWLIAFLAPDLVKRPALFAALAVLVVLAPLMSMTGLAFALAAMVRRDGPLRQAVSGLSRNLLAALVNFVVCIFPGGPLIVLDDALQALGL
ncbi:MAG: hypothetical protein FJX62_12550 [Alphaproteobacteria bacterium]|nr:hypothetical protein [Alphaproteobacteria bacterium]